MEETTRRVAKALFESGAVKFGEFTLTSGKKSPYYIDLRAVPSFPEQFDAVTDAYKDMIMEKTGGKCTLVGVPTAGLPFASVVGYKAKIPVAYIRKEALKEAKREHGTGKEIEGVIRDDMPPVLVDDLISTGKSNREANNVMKRNGFTVTEVFLLVDRQMDGVAALAAEGLNVHCVAKVLDIVDVLEADGLLEKGLADKVREYTGAGK